ncbi:MAG: hypothetical protein AAF502_07095 [Bacteroidota bacterium]
MFYSIFQDYFLKSVAVFICFENVFAVVEGTFFVVAINKRNGCARLQKTAEAFDELIEILEEDVTPDEAAKRSSCSRGF